MSVGAIVLYLAEPPPAPTGGARPDPRLDVLSPLGAKWRSWLPTVLRDSPDHLAVLHPIARETERLQAAIEQVRAQFFPQTADVLLKVYETELGLTREPEGVSLEERRSRVIAMLRKMASSPSGLDWQANVSAMIGAGWTYEEHDPDDPTSPPAYTVRITVPFPPTSGRYAMTEALLRDITPAHLDLIFQFSGGFVLDESQLDQEAMQ